MVDTERFHLGPHAVQAVGGIATALARERPTHALEIATHLPLDIESIARILDALSAEGVVTIETDEAGFKRVVLQKPDDYASHADLVREQKLCEDAGLLKNVKALRADAEWARKARDQHRVLRAVTSLGPKTDLDRLVSASDVPSARVRSALGDLETEGYARTDYDPETEIMKVEFPPITYPKERFERNIGLLTVPEEKPAAQVSPVWWVALGLATLVLALFILSRFLA